VSKDVKFEEMFKNLCIKYGKDMNQLKEDYE
jgi:hypothetical protein